MALLYGSERLDSKHRAKQITCLSDLPNEILVHVLDCFQTQLLLRHRAVSHRFLGLTIRIIHSRLLRAALLEDRKLILECYHPSAQYTEPYLYCDYLGTPGLSDFIAGDGRIYHIAEDPGSGGTLRKLYSHFRPTRKDPEPYIVRSHPAGDTPGSRTNEAANLRSLSREADVVTQQVNLEAHELFSQLCFSADLVQVGPRRGVFLSNVNIVDRKYTRIWRHWLAERAKNERANDTDGKRTLPKGLDESLEENGSSAQNVLWVDQSKIAGLRLRVKERRWRRDTPILMRQDEDEAVSYILELEEIIISMTHLMLAVERALLEKGQDSGKAVVFGSFAASQNTSQADENAPG